VPIAREAVQDPLERRVPGMGLGRDPVRTPMQWSAEPNAGFTRARPWLPLPSNYQDLNVEAQRRDPRSMLALYKRLIALRRAEQALHADRIELLEPAGNVLAYRRGGAFQVALNLGDQFARVPLPPNATIVLSTHLDRENERGAKIVALRPHEGLIVRLADAH
jgi:alpha-glucosidase